jgi:hypothetical protein
LLTPQPFQGIVVDFSDPVPVFPSPLRSPGEWSPGVVGLDEKSLDNSKLTPYKCTPEFVAVG